MPEEAPFAIPVSEMGKSGLAPPGVASYPTAGQGFSLNEQGHIPVVAKDGRMTVEIHFQSINLGNHVADAGGTRVTTIPGLVVGDLVEFMHVANSTDPMRGFIFTTDPVCVTEGTINLYSFNASGSAADLPARDFYFRITHRHL